MKNLFTFIIKISIQQLIIIKNMKGLDIFNKKKLSEIFLRKQDREKIEEQARQIQIAIPFDQNYFQVNVETHPTHLGLIKIEAIIRKGEKTGEKLNLKCKWYNKSSTDFKEIPQVNGCYYQPSIDDVNTSISIQAEPFMQGKKYEGLTIMRQLGTIKLDEKIQNQSKKATKDQLYEVSAKLEGIFSQNQIFDEIQTPQQISISITKQQLIIYLKIKSIKQTQPLISYDIKQNFPNIEMIRKTFNSFILSVNENQSFRISVEDNIKRDVLALVLRTFCCKKYLKNQEEKKLKEEKQQKQLIIEQRKNSLSNSEQKNLEDSTSEENNVRTPKQQVIEKNLRKQVQDEDTNIQFMLRLDEMSRNLSKLRRENEKLQQQYDNQRKMRSKVVSQLENLQSKLSVLDQLKKQNICLRLQTNKLNQENNFYINQIGVYKKQLREKQDTITELQTQIENFKVMENQKQSFLKQQIRIPEFKLQEKQELVLQQINIIKSLECNKEELLNKIENLLNQNKRLINRCESLAQYSSVKILENQEQKYKKLFSEKQQELTKLKAQIFSLQILLNKSKAEKKVDVKGWFSRDIKHNPTQHEKSKNSQIIIQSLQKLVTNLTETLTQKQMELQNQKSVNKQLIKKII